MSRLFVNRLTALDASLLDPSRGLLGQSWQLNVALEGSLDEQGMVLDFGEVKRSIKKTVDQYFDHRLLVPGQHAGCRTCRVGARLELIFELESGVSIHYQGPADAVSVLETTRIGSDELSQAIRKVVTPTLPDNVEKIDIELEEEQISGASYQYSHGLKHHDGNCQRIAHGHRSRIQIFCDERRHPDLEREWADRWRGIYIATRADLQREFTHAGVAYAHFRYCANQGQFDLTLPKDRCYFLDVDSTVENLAQHISDRLHLQHPESRFRVLAYEGIDKGAVGISGE